MPGSSRSRTCSIACAASSFARRIRSISCCGLDRAGPGEERRGVDAAAGTPRSTPRSNDGRLADHPVGDLRPLRQLEPDPAVESSLAEHVEGEVERAGPGRPRIVRVVAAEEPDVGGPGGAGGVVRLRLDDDQHRLAVAREDDDVVALHAPVAREIERRCRASGRRARRGPRPPCARGTRSSFASSRGHAISGGSRSGCGIRRSAPPGS